MLPTVTADTAEQGPSFSVSMRHAFIPFSGLHDNINQSFLHVACFRTVISHVCLYWTVGGMILAADYSQLELRVLAHLSKDQRLLQVSGKARQHLN